MRYFMMKEEPAFSLGPAIRNWYQTIDVRNVKQGAYHMLPDRIMLHIDAKPETVSLNLLLSPCFLVTEEVKECLGLYEPTMFFKEIVLLDEKYRRVFEYFLPSVEEVDCLTSKCRFNLDHSRLLYTEIDVSRVGDKSIFYLAGVSSKYIVVRQDVAESILRRGARGFLLEELHYQEGQGAYASAGKKEK